MTFTAGQIVEELWSRAVIPAHFGNTGGGVYNVVFTPMCQHDRVLGEIRASDNGDWVQGDIDEPAEGVTVMAYGADGDPLDEVHEELDLAGAVQAFEDLSYELERFCPQCWADHGAEGADLRFAQ